jgi:ABC-type glycerol-3-phosphate transport system substrate-binding protein
MPAPKGNQYAVGNSGQPPSKYTEEFMEQEAIAFITWFSNPQNIYFKRFALERGYPPDVLAEFAKKSEVFRRAYLFAKEWQECKIVEGALFNRLNSNFAKFAMANLSGWSDKQQISGDANNPLAFLLQKVDGQSKDLINADD